MILGFNLKMNPATERSYKDLIAIHRQVWLQKNYRAIKKVILFSPTLYLSAGLKQSRGLSKLSIGAQDGFYKDIGAFTGQVSLLMLKNIGVNFVIIGHSESRRYNLDDFNRVKLKLRRALELGFGVFYCFGEQAFQDHYDKVINAEFEYTLTQLKDIKNNDKMGRLYFVYEPCWAIGTQNAPPDYINRVITFVKTQLKTKYNIPNSICLYGGSVNSNNIKDLATIGLDGFLIGSASLDKSEVLKIYKHFNVYS